MEALAGKRGLVLINQTVVSCPTQRPIQNNFPGHPHGPRKRLFPCCCFCCWPSAAAIGRHATTRPNPRSRHPRRVKPCQWTARFRNRQRFPTALRSQPSTGGWLNPRITRNTSPTCAPSVARRKPSVTSSLPLRHVSPPRQKTSTTLNPFSLCPFLWM